METEIKYDLNGIEIIAKISIHKEFSECEKLISSPLPNSTRLLPNDLNLEKFDKVVIHCLIDENETEKIIMNSKSPQQVCVEIIENYAEQRLPNNQKDIYKTLTCSPSESQFMYLIKK